MSEEENPVSPGLETNEEGLVSGSWLDHLDELRDRLLKVAIAWIFASAACYFFSQEIIDFLKEPLARALPADKQKLYFTNVFETFLVHFKVAAYAGVYVIAPFVVYQVWAFVAPGLYPKERKLGGPFVVAATVLFLGGGLFTYSLVFPPAFEFLMNFGNPEEVTPLITLGEYVSTVIKMILLFGLAFELPVVIVLLGAIGILTSEVLRQKRKHAIVLLCIMSAVLSPPDILSMGMLMAPMFVFYEASIWIIALFEKARGKDLS